MLKRIWESIHRLGPILWQTLKRFEGAERRGDAAALTYTTLFALVPILTVIYSILSTVPALHEWGGEATASILALMLPDGSEQISEYLLAFSHQAKRLTWVGVVFLFVTSLSLLRTIERQFNKIWKVDEPRSGLLTFVRYWAVLTLGPVLIIGAIAASSVMISLPLLTDMDKAPLLVRIIPWLFSAGALTAVYLLVPNCRVPWRNALIAALIISVFIELGKFLFAKIVGMFPSYKLIYGAFAVVPLFLIWLYLAWMLLLFGAELSYALSHYTPKNKKVPLLWQRLLLAQKLTELQERGELLSESELAAWINDLTPVQLRLGLQYFQKRRLAALSQEGQWLWLRNPSQLSIADVLDELSLKELQAHLPDDLQLDDALKERWLKWQQERNRQSQRVMGQALSTLL